MDNIDIQRVNKADACIPSMIIMPYLIRCKYGASNFDDSTSSEQKQKFPYGHVNHTYYRQTLYDRQSKNGQIKFFHYECKPQAQYSRVLGKIETKEVKTYATKILVLKKCAKGMRHEACDGLGAFIGLGNAIPWGKRPSSCDTPKQSW